MKTTRTIEQYLDGTLSEDERKAFESELANEKELNNLLQLHWDVNESILDDELDRLRHKLSEILGKQDSGERQGRQARFISQKNKKKRMASPFFKAAAALIVLVSLGFVARILFGTRVSTDRIYQMYYTSYEPDINSRAAVKSISIIEQALLKYQQQDYAGAYNDLDTYLKQNPDNYTAQFFKGLVCLNQARYKRAMETFNKIPSNWNSPYAVHRDWYLSLAYIKLNRAQDAKTILTLIRNGGGYYSKKAAEILKKLDT